jgi:Tfp pilus assembly protein PilV
MGQRILTTGKSRRHGTGERGFTLVEVMMAGLVGVLALTANLVMFNYANRDFAYSRSLTEATNIATNQFSYFKTRTIAEINATVSTATTAEKTAIKADRTFITDAQIAGLLVGLHRETTTLGNCEPPADHYGITFCKNWEVWNVDVDSPADNIADMAGDIIKIRLTVNWTIGNRPHQITMTNMTTGKPS